MAVEVFVLSLADWLERSVAPYLPYVSEERRTRVGRYRFAGGKSRALWAELFARWRLREAGVDPADARLVHDARGKPFCPGTGLFLSLSHSGGWIAVSLGREESGVDVETKRVVPDIAARWFRPEENAALAALPDNRRDGALRRFWTLKESALKYTGEGLSGGLGSVDCLALIEAARGGARGVLGGRSFLLPDGAALSVAADSAALPEQARVFRLARAARGVFGDAAFIENAPIPKTAGGGVQAPDTFPGDAAGRPRNELS